ncbi:hypothetical protein [Actinomadura sp. SCN-SB]|uniref:hypothetical protein n=1 Tax=Actinomadura sp. SCN-SB TaxID=3373092 RepID=UPI003750F83F
MSDVVRLSAVTHRQGNNAALVDGEVRPAGFEFDWVDVPVLPQAFRRMVRTLEFDVSEMAVTTYLCAREHGVRFTALPVFLVRGFHHGAILHNTKADIAGPGDLAVEAALADLERTGLYPINHLVVIRDEVLDAHPGAAAAIYEAFVESKDRYVATRPASEPAGLPYRRVHDLTGRDPLPYGIEANRPMLERLMRHAVDQRILTRPVPVESLFAAV